MTACFKEENIWQHYIKTKQTGSLAHMERCLSIDSDSVVLHVACPKKMFLGFIPRW